METTELDNQKMKVLKEIADSNMILSGLQAEIKKLENDKEAFFQLRKDELSGELARFYRDSKALVDDTEKNYVHVHNFYDELNKFAEVVKQQREDVQGLIVGLNKQSVDFENHLVREIEKLSDLKARIKHDMDVVEQERNFVRSQREEMTKEKAVFAARQKELNTALQSLNKR